MSQTLLEIAEDCRSLSELLDSLEGGEMTPESEEALSAWFAAVGAAKSQKLDSYCAIIRTFELRAACRKEESERMAKLAQSETNKAKALKDRMKLFLELTGDKKIETARYRISLCGNGGKQPLDAPTDPAAVPPMFHRVKVEVDNDAIREALTNGLDVPGCKLLPRGMHIKIS